MYNVKFLKGAAASYTALEAKDANTFYYIDEKDLYLGSIKLSNDADLQAAIKNITQNASDIDAIEAQLKTLVGESGSGSIQSMIDTAITGVKNEMGNLEQLNTTKKDSLVNSINEVLAAVNAGGTAAAVTMDTTTTTQGMAKSYTLKQGESTIGTIDIPKDMVVKSGAVEVDPEGQDKGTYIVLTLANATEDKVYVNVGKLVDIYTAKQNATQIQLSIDSTTREISAAVVAGSISSTELADDAIITAKIANGNVTKEKLSTALQGSIDKADSALQKASIATGTANGTIAVGGDDIAVKGLGSAAYANTDAFDATGAADTALASAKSYADGLAKNYATAAQGAKADTALQAADIKESTENGKITIKDQDVAIHGLGSAAYAAASSFDAAGSATTAETNAKAYADGLAKNYDAKGAADTALESAKSYVDGALTWGTIGE